MTPCISSKCPASLVRFASSRSRTFAVMLFNASRGLSISPHTYEGGGVSPVPRLSRILSLVLILESEKGISSARRHIR